MKWLRSRGITVERLLEAHPRGRARLVDDRAGIGEEAGRATASPGRDLAPCARREGVT
jgi:hypothetical protein